MRPVDPDGASVAGPRDDVREHEEQQRKVAVDVVQRAAEDPVRLEPASREEQDRAEERLDAGDDLGHREPCPVALSRFATGDLRPESPDPAEREDGDDREPDDAMQGRHGADTTEPGTSARAWRSRAPSRARGIATDSSFSAVSGAAPDDLGPDRLRGAVSQRDRPLDGRDPAPEAAHGRRQGALSRADRHARGRDENGGELQPSVLRERSGQRGEPSPREREPQVRMEGCRPAARGCTRRRGTRRRR